MVVCRGVDEALEQCRPVNGAIEVAVSLARFLGAVANRSGITCLEGEMHVHLIVMCSTAFAIRFARLLVRNFLCAVPHTTHSGIFLVQELRQNDVIDRLKAFTMIPPPGTVIEVSAGETQPLRLAYSADSLTYGGVHDLPVLVSRIASVYYGKISSSEDNASDCALFWVFNA